MSHGDALASLSCQITEKTRKPQDCPYCGAYNGPVKKNGTLKIVHEKYIGKDKKCSELGVSQSTSSTMQLRHLKLMFNTLSCRILLRLF